MPIQSRRLFVLLSLAIILTLLAPTAALEAADPPAHSVNLDDGEALEAFFDGLAAAQLASFPVAGMTISVVKDGQMIFAKGYGLADVEANIAVDAATTLFRAGSVSKLFVWTAMMQQVQAGTLDLDADVNTYLDFEIPATYEQAVTLRHLMTHTAGFEDQGLGLFLSSADHMNPLPQYLAENIPTRIFPPGEISAYSNYSASLAAYIVQRVTGVPFHEYVEQNIFEPLGMEHSTFRQPLPPPLADNLANGYLYSQGQFTEGIFEFVQSYPAGALSTTAPDMARFMIAHLQNGRYGEAQILEPETAQQMHSLAFSHDPRLPGWGAGITVADVNGQRVLGHGGDTTYFHNELALFPDQDVGLFVSTNSDGGTLARFHLLEAFRDRYILEDGQGLPLPSSDSLQDPGKYTGAYFPARMNATTIEKFLLLLQPVQVRATEEGLLAATGIMGNAPTYWKQIEPEAFAPASHSLPDHVRLIFLPEAGDEDGIRYLFFDQAAYIKQPFYGSPGFNFALLGVSVLAFLFTAVVVPVAAIRRRFSPALSHFGAPESLFIRSASWLAWLFALLNLTFLVGFFAITSDINNVVFGLPPVMQVLLRLPWLSLLVAAALLALTVLLWLRRYGTAWRRILLTVYALVTIVYLWFLLYWNLL